MFSLEPKQVVNRKSMATERFNRERETCNNRNPCLDFLDTFPNRSHRTMLPGGQCSKVTFRIGEHRAYTFNLFYSFPL